VLLPSVWAESELDSPSLAMDSFAAYTEEPRLKQKMLVARARIKGKNMAVSIHNTGVPCKRKVGAMCHMQVDCQAIINK
jgi:hypothetical protein